MITFHVDILTKLLIYVVIIYIDKLGHLGKF